jgi:hypothetical protein
MRKEIFASLLTARPGCERDLCRLDEICLKADLIRMSQELKLPKFSGDGEYLVHHTVGELTKELGGPLDDAKNTFTASWAQ